MESYSASLLSTAVMAEREGVGLRLLCQNNFGHNR